MEKKKINCPICDLEAFLLPMQNPNTNRIECPVCGEFNIDAEFDLMGLTEDEKIKLRYYYYTAPKRDERLRLQNYITKSNKNAFLNNITHPKTMEEKIKNIMHYLCEQKKPFGEYIQIDRKNGHRLFFCKDEKEFESILKDLEEKKYIQVKKVSTLDVLDDNKKPLNREIALTSEGYKYIETPNPKQATQCFIAMWFNKCTNDFCKTTKQIIENDTGYQILKIDDYEHINYIPIEILTQIKNSRFVIADLTGHRGGVYYEAGYAEALGIPVIYTCRKDWFKEKKDKKGKVIQNGVHFDIQQKNILMWQNNKLDEYQEKLLKRIKEVIGLNKS